MKKIIKYNEREIERNISLIKQDKEDEITIPIKVLKKYKKKELMEINTKKVQKLYRDNHRFERNKYSRDYWKNNEERIKKVRRKYYLKNRGNGNMWKDRNKDYIKWYSKLPEVVEKRNKQRLKRYKIPAVRKRILKWKKDYYLKNRDKILKKLKEKRNKK
jgi:hypothetical protein